MPYEAKTKPTIENVDDFLKASCKSQKLEDCYTLVKLMENLTGKKAVLWAGSIVCFGNYHYVYASGTEGDAGLVGFAPRKSHITIYIASNLDFKDQVGEVADLMQKLGKNKHGKCCIHIKQISDIDLNVLEELIKRSIVYLKQKYKTDLD